MTETITVTITVLDNNDVGPKFIAAPYSASVPENSPINTTILTVQAVDLDKVVLFRPNFFKLTLFILDSCINSELFFLEIQ